MNVTKAILILKDIALAPNRLFTSLMASFLLFPNPPLQAQIVPDATLPNNSSVTLDGNRFTIDGGSTAGSNLFHSFSQFSIPTNTEVFFNNAQTIENIFSRVTGSSISTIDGLIGANGTANLFLLNPNGIVFGSNARLNIGGSFLGSTANRINFADGTQFSATNPQAQPLLTVTVPVGLGLSSNSGAIEVQGTGHTLKIANPFFPLVDRGTNLTGLQVLPGKTLALVGGDITLTGGVLLAEGGRIELGSVDSGLVSLNYPSGTTDWTLSYQGVENFRNIQLTAASLADASGTGSGSIQVQGARVTLTDGSVILIQNQGPQPGGDIIINASESLELIGTNSDPVTTVRSNLDNQTVGLGDGGNILVSTPRLLLHSGAAINTRTFFTTAKGGDITVNASESVQLKEFAPINPILVSNIGATTNGPGDAGNITVSTGRLTLLDGTNITSPTTGTGSGGNIIVNATESVELIGLNPFNQLATSVTVATFNEGNAGTLIVNTNKLLLQDGGRIDSSTFAGGNAGSVIVNASESVEVRGKPQQLLNPSAIIASANIVDPFVRQAFNLPPVPSGDSGNVTINTSQLRVTDGAQVTVRNDGTGRAGKLTINADSIILDKKGGITASTNVGESAQEGSISLNVRNSLQLRRNSIISAEAQGEGRGGNITINAGVIGAVPQENSDITASAPQGTGGRITINAQAIFGTQVRPTLTSESDITAEGKTAELNGTIIINTPELKLESSLLQQESNFVNTEQAIANSCFTRRNAQQGSFTVTGTSGLPTTPYEALSSRYAVTQIQGLSSEEGMGGDGETGRWGDGETRGRGDAGTRGQERELVQNIGEQSSSVPTWKLGDSIVEAQGMTLTSDGRIIVGTAPQLIAARQVKDIICNFSTQEISTR